MAYAKQTWADGDPSKPLSAARMNYIESGIEAAAAEGGGSAGTSIYVNAYDNGISSNSTADQSTALTALYAAAPANSVVYFGPTLQPIVGLHVPGKSIRILGAGRSSTEFRAPASPGTNAIIVNFASNANCLIEHVYVNGNGNANVARGISGIAAPTVRFCRVANCTQGAGSTAGGRLDPHGYGAAGIYCSQGGSVESCEVTDCVYPIFMNYPNAETRVVNNVIRAVTDRINTNQGISFIRWNQEPVATIYAGSLCQGNTIRNVGFDPQNQGQNGNGIQIEHCTGIRVFNNTISDCEGAGIHPATRAYDTKVIGNDISYCGIDTAGGITLETHFGTSTARPNGCVVSGNTVHHNSKYGIMPSYSAGTVITGNTVHDNGWEGIWSDSDRCQISDNQVYDNCRLNAAPVPSVNPNFKAQIKATATSHKCQITGNQVWHDLTSTKYALYGIAVTDNAHIIKDNVLTASGTTAGLYETASVNNIVGDNIDPGEVSVPIPGANLFNGYFTAPDSAGLSVTSDIDLQAQLTPNTWASGSAQRVIAKWSASTGEYLFQLSGTGAIMFGYYDGSFRTYTSTATVGFTDGSRHWIRATRVQSTGAVMFYTSDDGTTWTQLGTTITGTTAAAVDTTLVVGIGSDSAAASKFQGVINRATVRSGVGGTLVADFNPALVTRTAARTPASYTDTQGNVWTGQTVSWDWTT